MSRLPRLACAFTLPDFWALMLSMLPDFCSPPHLLFMNTILVLFSLKQSVTMFPLLETSSKQAPFIRICEVKVNFNRQVSPLSRQGGGRVAAAGRPGGCSGLSEAAGRCSSGELSLSSRLLGQARFGVSGPGALRASGDTGRVSSCPSPSASCAITTRWLQLCRFRVSVHHTFFHQKCTLLLQAPYIVFFKK